MIVDAKQMWRLEFPSVAVQAFLDGAVGFMAIARIVERVLTRAPTGRGDSLEDIAEADRAARGSASGLISAA